MSNIKNAKTIDPVKDDKLVPLVKVTYLERIADVAIAESYGIHGSAPKNTPCIMLTVGNDESNRWLIPLSATTRTKNLKETEFECGNFVVGSIITFDENGNINMVSKNNVKIAEQGGNINITADYDINIVANGNDVSVTSEKDINIEAKGNDINVIGDMHVVGGIDTTGDVVAGTISLKTHLTTLVQPGVGTSGPPV